MDISLQSKNYKFLRLLNIKITYESCFSNETHTESSSSDPLSASSFSSGDEACLLK